MKSMRSISSASQQMNKFDDSFFQNDEMFHLQKPIQQLNLKFATDNKIPSPWSTVNPHIIQSHRINQIQTICPQKIIRKQLSFRTNKEVILKKPVDNNQETYKMNNTLVQFRVRATLNREGLKSRKNERSPEALQILEINLTRKQVSCNHKASQKSNRSRLYSIGQEIQKTPRIQFLQSKFKIKQFSGISPNKRKTVTTVKHGVLDTLDSSKRIISFRQRNKIRLFNTVNISGSNQAIPNINKTHHEMSYC